MTDVRTISPDASLLNDSVLDVTALTGGLNVVCDGPVVPASIKLPTCFVTMDFPVTPFNMSQQLSSGLPVVFAGAIPMTLAASVTANGNSIFWFPFREAMAWALEQLATIATQTETHGSVLVRLTLKGNFIWSQGCSSITLDGDTLAKAQRDASGNLYSALQLPSGDGRPGGNFESWFWVPGYCDKSFPKAFVPFQQITSVAGPDPSGDRVVVGMMTGANFATATQKLPVSDVTVGKIYCQPVQMGPGTLAYAYVATAAERLGNFSAFGAPILDPLTGAAFPGNQIPASRLPSPSATASPGVFAWRVRSILPAYGYYGYGSFQGIGAELI